MMLDKKLFAIEEIRKAKSDTNYQMNRKEQSAQVPSDGNGFELFQMENEEYSSVDVSELDEMEQQKHTNALKRRNGYQRSRTTITRSKPYHDVPVLSERDSIVSEKDRELSEFLNDIHKILATINSVRRDQKVIGLTSALPGEGSSTLASILATLAAGMENGTLHASSTSSQLMDKNKKILLIDTQLHNPTLHKNFGIPSAPGLFDVLQGKISLEHAGHHVSSHLQVLPLGEKRKSSFSKQELLNLIIVLKEAKYLYDTVYIDLPSILQYPEGLSLSRVCDAVILVIKARKTRVEVLQDARRKLERSGVEILGGILNKRRFFIPDWIYNKL